MSPKGNFLKELFVFIYFFETLCTHVGLSEKFKTGFVPKPDEDFLEEGPGVTISQSFSDDQTFSYQDEEGTITVLGSPIKFDPPSINFKQQPIGVPGLRKVRVFNINSHSSIQMLSISGNTNHIHCSFFTDKVIPPGGNATFDVVFLGRDAGVIDNTLYIHTSAGSFRYTVEGEATANPYRLRPLVGIKMPVNSSYNPVIQLHNPHPTTIQVLEMSSSGGDLHLELPTEEGVADKQMWEIPPYHTKSVIRASFNARSESNNTAYIRIRTNSTNGEFLFLPLEIEVTSTPGIYSPQEMLNFGELPSDGGPVTLEVPLINSGSRPVTVASLVSNPVTDALSIDFASVKVAPSTSKTTVVARVTYDPALAKEEGPQIGKLIIKTKNSQHRVVLPWTVSVLKGGLNWNQTFAKFLVTDIPDPEDPSQEMFLSKSRTLMVENTFSVPVVVHSLELPADAHQVFQLGKFKAKVIKPGETTSIVKISVKEWAGFKEIPWQEIGAQVRIGSPDWKGVNMHTHLTLNTNISSRTIPLVVFDGKLRQFFPGSPSEDILDFGTIGMSEKREAFFALVNPGPVKVVLRGWGGNITGSLIELMGVGEGNETDIMARTNLTTFPRKLYVPPNHYVVYRIGLLTGNKEGEMWASVFVSTEFEDVIVPFKFRVAEGSLSTVPDQLNFGTNFPGRRSELSLHVHSSFKHTMRVKTLSVVGGDPRFSFDLQESATIEPDQKSEVGLVVFDPGATCRPTDDCYTGFSPWGKFGHPWYLGLALPLNLGEMDLSIVATLWSRMRATAMSRSVFNVTLRLDTTEVRGFQFTARAALSWPILCLDSLKQFPLTQVGNTSRQEVFLINPSQDTVLVHLVPLATYPNPQSILHLLPNRIQHEELTSVPDFEDATTFTIESVTDAYDQAEVATFGNQFQETVGIGIAANTYPIILGVGQAVKVTVVFAPQDAEREHQSVLMVRNNLTGLETIDLVGKGATGDLKFGNRRTGTTFSHAFDVTENHLKDCDKERSASQPNLTVKRHFTARNTGQVPIWVTGFEIDGYACEGYGFKVLDCEPFELAPNQHRRINIAFTPDFTLSHITRTLTMKTSLSTIPGRGDVTYALVATVPAHLLAVCAGSLPRPRWEGYLYILMISLMVVSLLCVLVAAVMESDRLLHFTYITCDQVPESAKLLDLREVARRTLEEFAERERSSSPASPSPPLDLINTPAPAPSRFLWWPTAILKYLYGFLKRPTLPSLDPRSPTPPQQPNPRRSVDERPVSESSVSSKASSPRSKKKSPETEQPTPPTTAKKKKQNKSSEASSSPATKPNRPKISAQSSVNEDLDASSTTTESSNPEEISDNIVAKVVNLNSDLPVFSASGGADSSGKKKKKKNKVEEQPPPPAKESKPMQTKPKKVLEKQDSKPDKPEKLSRSSPKFEVKSASPVPATPPPVVKKQEAKVKGVPKENPDLRRQQSLPTYDKPPRMQQSRHESHSGFPSPPNQPLDGFPPPTTPRADPPRAIIYPELKRDNPVNQFGAIGCKVPVNQVNSWSDSFSGPPSHLAISPPSRVNNVAGSPHGLITSPPGGISTMAELQAERRLREEFHHRRIQWPGFGPEPGGPVRGGGSYIESLWDPPTGTSGHQQPPPPAGRWGSIGTIGQNVWPSSVLQSQVYTARDKGAEGEVPGGYGIDPLSISSIWTAVPNKNERDSNTWSSALFKKDL